jgi:phospholipid/cholesterol/gamma-HCH transport system permease protein
MESDLAASPSKATINKTGDKVVITIEGDWNLRQVQHSDAEKLVSNLDKQSGVTSVEFDSTHLGSWDTTLLIFVARVEEWCHQHQVKFGRETLPPNVASLIALSEEVPERKTGRNERSKENLFLALGNAVLAGKEGVSSTLAFTGEVALSLGRMLRGKAAFDWRLFWLTMEECSARALPIVGLISFLTGLILAFVGAIQLRQFGAGIFVANLVAVAMNREMGAIMTGVIMAGRTGAAFAAQIGSMKVSEEIDALKTLAISPMDYLVSPRLAALFLMMPLLVLYADLIGILGGACVGIGMLKITWVQYWNQTIGSFGISDVLTGLVKSAVFGGIVAMAGCQRGMQCGNNAAAVGNAATSAVVDSITWIVASDALIDVVQEVIKAY